MADPAAICTTQPLVYGLLVPGNDDVAYTAGIHTTVPLALGINLVVTGYALTAEAFDCPFTPRDVALLYTANTADIGTSQPLALGLLLGTSGTTNYTLTAEAFSCPVTMQDVTLRADAPAGVQTTMPLILGLLLDSISYTLTAEAFDCPISFAPSLGLDYYAPDSSSRSPGGYRTPQFATGSRKEMLDDLFKDTLPKLKRPEVRPTPLERRMQPVVEEAFTDEDMLLLL